MSLEDTLQVALRDPEALDPRRSEAALRAVTDAAARSRRRGQVRRITAATLPAAGLAAAAIGLWAILPGGDEEPAAPPVSVPDVRGLREDQAWARLRALGLTADVVSAPSALPGAGGTVVAQRPSPGANATPPGGQVRISVAEVASPVADVGNPVAKRVYAGMGCIPASCDELRLAAWPRRGGIRLLTATIDGQRIRLHPVPGTDYWQGSLPRSGVAARLLAARGTLDAWAGAGPTVVVDVRLRMSLADGSAYGHRAPVVVRPGWG